MPFLYDWETNVNAREGFTPAEKKRMLLSQETILGLKSTGISLVLLLVKINMHCLTFIEFLPFLFSKPEVKDNKLAF